MIPWDHLFAAAMTDYFLETPYEVDCNHDKALKRLFTDVTLVRRVKAASPQTFCDGFDDLSTHNLIMFKSGHETLEEWSLEELCGFYVGYRKLNGLDKVDPRYVRLVAVATNFPRDLGQRIDMHPYKKGVYKIRWGLRGLTIIVPKQTEENEENALWSLFGWDKARVDHGLAHYKPRDPAKADFLEQIAENLRCEN